MLDICVCFQRKLSLSAVENMRSVHGTRYKVGTAANILCMPTTFFTRLVSARPTFADPSSGGADDWAKAEAGIKYVFSIELRPSAGRGNGFLVHPRNIIPTGEETWAGIRAVADRILSKCECLIIVLSEPHKKRSASRWHRRPYRNSDARSQRQGNHSEKQIFHDHPTRIGGRHDGPD